MEPSDDIALLDAEPAAATTPGSSSALTDLVNDVYAVAESGMWRDGATRTTPPSSRG